MISIKTNINIVNQGLINKLQGLADTKALLRPVAFDVLALMRERIHEDGLAADDSSLGDYNSKYLKFRNDNGRGTGGAKKRFSFSRQLEKALDTGPTEKGYAIIIVVDQRLPLDNFLNKKNKAKGKKATKIVSVSNKELIAFLEEQTGKKVWKLSKSEREYAIAKYKKLVAEKLNTV